MQNFLCIPQRQSADSCVLKSTIACWKRLSGILQAALHPSRQSLPAACRCAQRLDDTPERRSGSGMGGRVTSAVFATPPSAQMAEWHKEVAKNSTCDRETRNALRIECGTGERESVSPGFMAWEKEKVAVVTPTEELRQGCHDRVHATSSSSRNVSLPRFPLRNPPADCKGYSESGTGRYQQIIRVTGGDD